jgi:hypothetical protein
MTTAKILGVWMDHSNAHLMEVATDPVESDTMVSSFSNKAGEPNLHKSISLVYNNMQRYQSDYFGKLEEIIKNYEEVLLFGPAQAKAELFNKLKGDRLLEKIKIEVKQTEKMTEGEQYAFVKEYFSNQ